MVVSASNKHISVSGETSPDRDMMGFRAGYDELVEDVGWVLICNSLLLVAPRYGAVDREGMHGGIAGACTIFNSMSMSWLAQAWGQMWVLALGQRLVPRWVQEWVLQLVR